MVETVGLLILSATGIGEIGVGGLLGGGIFGGATFGGITIFGIGVPTIVGTVAITAGVIGLQYALRPKPPKPEDGRQSIKLAISPGVVAVGLNRLGGTYALYEVAAVDGSSVDILAHTLGRLTAFRGHYLHDDLVTLDGGGFVQALADGRDGGQNIYVENKLGDDPDVAFAHAVSLFPDIWTSAHRGDGIAKTFMRCKSVPAESYQKIYPNNLPVYSAKTSGFALWDFRDAAQNPDVAASWVNYPAWSAAITYAAGDRVLRDGEVFICASNSNFNHDPLTAIEHWVSAWRNPVVQIVNKLVNRTWGMRLRRAVVVDPVIASLTIEANLCDQMVLKKDGSFEPRYRCDTFWTRDTDPGQVIGQMLAACDGWMVEDMDGTIALRVGVFSEAIADLKVITAADMAGFGISNAVGAEEVVNELQMQFTSPAFNFRETPGPSWRDEASISELGIVRPRPLDLVAVQSFSQGRRLAKQAMLRLSAARRGHVVTKPPGIKVFGHRFARIQRPGIAGLEDIVVELQNGRVDFRTMRCSYDWITVDRDAYNAWDPYSEEGEEPLPADSATLASLPVPQNVHVEPQGDGTTGLIYIVFVDLERTDLTYVVRARAADDGTGNPGDWAEVNFQTSTTESGETFLAWNNPVSTEMEFQVAVRGTRRTVGEWSDSAFFETTTLALLDELGDFMLDETGHQILAEA